jgi:hypothetical protein
MKEKGVELIEFKDVGHAPMLIVPEQVQACVDFCK